MHAYSFGSIYDWPPYTSVWLVANSYPRPCRRKYVVDGESEGEGARVLRLCSLFAFFPPFGITFSRVFGVEKRLQREQREINLKARRNS